jgi:hypothetical protein
LQELDKRLYGRYPEDPSPSTDKPSSLVEEGKETSSLGSDGNIFTKLSSKHPMTGQSSSAVAKKIAREDSSTVNRPYTRSEKKAALEERERESRRANIALARDKLRMESAARESFKLQH